MVFPAITALYAALFGLILFVLSVWVITSRVQGNVLIGDGGHDDMTRRMRAHANFTEYMPLVLILAAFYEAAGGSPTTLRVILTVMLVARVLHPFGMLAKENSVQQYVCRGAPAILTCLSVLGLSVLLLIKVA